MITSTTHTINNGNITVAEGSDVTLSCEATGDGTQNYQWRRVSPDRLPRNTNASDEQILTIYDIRVNNGGEYYCEVGTGKNKESSMRVQVTVRSELL